MKTRFIAEFCQNHLGKRQILEEMINQAKKSGFTHGKIQGLYSYELTNRPDFEILDSKFYRPYQVEYNRLSKLDLTEEDERWFFNTSIDVGIIPMITVFTHSGVERAKKSGFKSIKIASYDCSSLPLIESVAKFAEEIVVSTGATSWEDISKTAKLLSQIQRQGRKVALLHARTLYPVLPLETGLAKMQALSSFEIPIGYSDHSNTENSSLLASKFALLLGANVIERHFTVLPKHETRDGPVSINSEQARELVKFDELNYIDKVLNLGKEITELGKYLFIENLEPTDKEKVNSKYYKGRVASKINGKIVYGWEYI
jgi:N,N'-diacetyllegionaminate synthase